MRPLSPLSPLSLAAAVSGCGAGWSVSGGVAIVTLEESPVEFTLDTCGLDGQTLRLSGEAETGARLAASFDVEDDDQTALVETSAITVSDIDGVDLAAYGTEAWARRGETGDAPGEDLNARISSSHIQMAGQIAVVDEDGRPTGDELEGFSLDGDCVKR